MCGYTCFASGHVANKNVMIPIHEIVSGNYSSRVQKNSREWQRLLATTGQPAFLND
jgi:6-phosphofructokinase 1